MDHRNLYEVIVRIAHSRSAFPAAAAGATKARHRNDDPKPVEQPSLREPGGASAPAPVVPGPAPVSRWRRELRWGTDEFTIASGLARQMVEGSRIATVLKAIVRREPRRALLATQRAPIAVARMRASDEKQMRTLLPPAGRAVFAGTRAQAVLDIPMDPYGYLSGKHRQAVRTNIRQAAKAEIVCERSSGYADWLVSAQAVLRARDNGEEALATMGPPTAGERVLLYAAKDADGTPVAVAGTVMYGDLAYLFTLLSDPDHKTSASSRYILHTFAALDLGQEGARHLVVGSALREREGNQYFQHLLGYRVRNLRVDITS